MARGARVALARCPHHIVQRGHNRRIVFVTNGDRQSYLETLAEFRWHFYIPAYVNLPYIFGDLPSRFSG
jgi:putative transposase